MRLLLIIVSYNSQTDLKRLLPSALNQESVEPEIIIVDNASTDRTVPWLEKKYPQIKLIKNQTNRGFGAANNQAVKQAKAELLMFLNPDTELKPDCLKTIINWFKHHPAEAVAGCQLLNSDGSIQPSGGYLPNLVNLFCWAGFLDDLPLIKASFKAYQVSNPRRYLKPTKFGWLTGAALIYRRSAFELLAGFDEQIFMYGEEVELAHRAKQQCWNSNLIPQAQVVHFSPAFKPAAILGEYQGLIYFFSKHKSQWQNQLLKLVLRLGAKLRIIVFRNNKALKEVYEKAVELAR